jgi:glycosyltransferase involved in cell wall biosynthesis
VVALVPNRRLRYVEDDLRILAGTHDVHVVAREEHASRRQLLPALARHFVARRPDVLWVWFADPYDTPYALLMARAFGVRSVVVAGGYDVASLPAFRYGALTTRAARWQARSALRLADVVLATSRFIESEVRALGRVQDVRTVHLGVDCERFTPGGPREPLVLTVGHADADAWRLKGLDVFAACSRLVPELRFVIVGRCSDPAVASALRAAGGPNLTLVERDLDTPELLAWYRRASVYAQLSVRESFGLALAEAMACGCAPVATTAGSLPEVVGDTGVLVPWGDAHAAARAIAHAAASDDGIRASQRIRDTFPLTARGEEVLATVSALLGAEMPREERRAAG